MPRSLLLLALAATLAITAACGGGESKPNTAPTSTPRAESSADDATATPEASDDDAPDDDEVRSEGGLGSIFGSVLGSGLSGGSGAATGAGDPELKRFLPGAADFPDGLAPMGEFTFSSPDGISADGKIDIAMTMAVAGDITQEAPDFSKFSMLMAMVMEPEDLQDLGGAFDDLKDLDKEDIENEIRAGLGDMEGFDLQDWEVLDADGLGEGGFGIQMTMSLGQFAEMFGAAGAGGEMPEAMTMRMYLFAQGDYMAATLRMNFSDTLPSDADERAVAEAIEAKLKGG